MKTSQKSRKAFFAVAALLIAAAVHAGFQSAETFLPAIGRVSGQGGSQFYTTVWATNLTGSDRVLHVRFLEAGTGQHFADIVFRLARARPDEGVREHRRVQTRPVECPRRGSHHFLGRDPGRRTHLQPGAGRRPRQDRGTFFAGVPKSFSVSPGQSASIQGVNQGGTENFRYNFALVETGGGSPTVNVQLLDGNGSLLGQKAYVLQPYEQIQPNVADLFAGIFTTNARITATVTEGPARCFSPARKSRTNPRTPPASR